VASADITLKIVVPVAGSLERSNGYYLRNG
jgi:hypothetical protein